MSLFDVFNVAGSAMSAQSQRLNVVASNLANADSVTSSDGQPYKSKQVVFAAVSVGGESATGVQVQQVVASAISPENARKTARSAAEDFSFEYAPLAGCKF